jgi:hypothetical protein
VRHRARRPGHRRERRWAQEHAVLTGGDTYGGGGRGAHRWWGGAGSDARRRGRQGCDVEWREVGSRRVNRATRGWTARGSRVVVSVSVGQHGVGRVARGRSGGQGGHAHGRSVERVGVSRPVGPLDPGNESLVHHTR